MPRPAPPGGEGPPSLGEDLAAMNKTIRTAICAVFLLGVTAPAEAAQAV